MTQEHESPDQVAVTLGWVNGEHGPTVAADIGVDNFALRRLIGTLPGALNAAQQSVANATLDRADDLYNSGDAATAAATLVDMGHVLTALPSTAMERVERIARDPNVPHVHALSLLAALSVMHERAGEWVLAREAAERVRNLATEVGDDEAQARALIAIARALTGEGQTAHARAAYAEAIGMARTAGLHPLLAQGYHALGEMDWQEGHRERAFAEWDRELETCAALGGEREARCRAFIAERYEQIDKQRAITLYQRVVADLTDATGPFALETRAEAAYRLAAILISLNIWQGALNYARTAVACNTALVNRETSLAWCYQIMTLAFEGLGDVENAAQCQAERNRLVGLWGHEYDRFGLLVSQWQTADESEARVAASREAEKIAVTMGPEMRAVWHAIAAQDQAREGEMSDALDHVRQALLLANDVDAWRNPAGPFLIHDVAAELFSAAGDLTVALGYAQQAVDLDASNLTTIARLAVLQLRTGHVVELEDTATLLDQRGAGAIALQLRALAAVAQGDFGRGVPLVVAAYRDTNDDFWRGLRDECLDVSGGIAAVEQSHLVRAVRAFAPVEAATAPLLAAPQPLLPGIPFYDRVLQLCVGLVIRLQGRAPDFVRRFLDEETTSLREEDFRDLFLTVAGTHFSETRGEEIRSRGPSDVVIPSEDGSGRRVRMEFKVWGRHEYAGVVGQLLDYVSDDEEIGIVYMVNKNRGSIVESYRQVVILDQANYVPGSLRERPIRPDLRGLPHYRSEHLTPGGRRMTIYHVIHSIYP